MHKTLCLGSRKRSDIGKLERGPEVALTGTALAQRRLFVKDKRSGECFLIDTGAALSVIPPKKFNIPTPEEFTLYAANGSKIKTYGEKDLNLDFGLRRPIKWTFIIADVPKPIVGADLIFHYGLIVDIKGQQLIDKTTGLSTKGRVTNEIPSFISAVPEGHPYGDLLKRFPNITRPSAAVQPIKHTTEHYIETTGQPVHAKARRLAPEKYKAVKEEFQNMVEQGICRPSKSPWASALHVVTKKDGTVRPCGDFRQLNAQTIPDRYGVPNLMDFRNNLHGKTVFSRLDLIRAYYHIPIREQDVPKTAIITPFGLFEFLRMCFGLRNAAQTFQRFMDGIFGDLNFCFVLLDDLLVASSDLQEHLQHLEEVFRRLEQNGLTLNPEKCEFGQPEIDFLGYHITPEGIKPQTCKVEAIMNYPKPKDVKALRRMLGMINFYRPVIPNAAAIMAPLNKYLRGTKKNDRSLISWNEESHAAFEKCKTCLRDSVLLAHPKFDGDLSLACDASNQSMGAVLQQREKEHWVPLGFFSKSLSESQRNYSAYDRELLAIYTAIRHFRPVIEGRTFTILTDHKPLIYAMFQKSTSASPMRIRWLTFISQFSTDIQHIGGEDNPVADALSRVEELTLTKDLERLARLQKEDEEVKLLKDKTNIDLKLLSLPGSDSQVLCETSTGKARIYLPKPVRREMFDAIHGPSHPGIRVTKKMMKQRYFWPSMCKDIAEWARICIPCQTVKVTRHTVTPPGQFDFAGRFDQVHIDIVGPLPSAQGKRYCITFVDRYTRWPEAVPVEEITAEVVAWTFYKNWISRFGVPCKVTTDQGRQFESDLFRSLTKFLGTEKISTTPYHPQSNGCVERWHRSLKTALMAHLNTTDWYNILPIVLLGLRVAIREDVGISVSEAVYGQTLRLPGEFLSPSQGYSDVSGMVHKLQEFMENIRPAEFRVTNKTIFLHKSLKTCSHVFLRDDRIKKSLSPPYSGPYPVLTRTDKTCTLKLPKRELTVSLDRVKPAFTVADTGDSTASTTPQQPAEDVPSTTHNVETPRLNPLVRTRYGRTVKPNVRFMDAVIGGSDVAVATYSMNN